MGNTKTTSFRHALPIAAGLILLGFGLFALARLSHSLDPALVIAQIKAAAPLSLALAVAATGVGYAALVGYDALALRFIGTSLPARIVVLGGFLGYAFGNTMGISVISGGAIRYRVYSAFGLSALQVATVSGYVAAALGTGLTLVGLAALSLYPDVITHIVPFAPATLRHGALIILAVAVAAIVLISLRHRRVHLWRFDLHLPSPANLATQLVIVLADVFAAAFALWILMPAGTPGFGAFVAIYAIAMMLGILSHVPGGIGVFETIVLGTLAPSVAVSEAAAALVLFRVIYYLLPFAAGIVIVSLNEARLAGGPMARLLGRVPASTRPAIVALHGLAPSAAALLAFGFGVYLLLVSMVPSVRNDAIVEGEFVAALLAEGGTLLSAMIGLVLLVLAHGLGYRIRAAFVMTFLALCLGAGAALLNGFDLPSALLLLAGALVLLPFSSGFTRPAMLTDGLFTPAWFAIVLAVGAAGVAFFFFLYQTTPYSNDLWTEIAHGASTPRALRAGLLGSALVLLVAIHLGIRPTRQKPAGHKPSRTPRPPHPTRRPPDTGATHIAVPHRETDDCDAARRQRRT